MKLSYDWLNDFVDLKDTDVNTVAQKLTMGAFEVEDIEKFGDKLEGEVVLGEIREISKHPDADKIQITKTCIGKNPDGTDFIEQIVCGAKNISVGQKVPVAKTGAKVFNRKDGTIFEIKKAKIRGVESHGMICSPDELGFSPEESENIKAKQGDGIYVLFDPNNSKIENLAKDFAIGTDIRKVFGIKADYVLEIGARSNRGDALCVLGQAREVAALFSKEIKHSEIKDLNELTKKHSKVLILDNKIKSVAPAIDDEKDCAVFHTVTIEGFKVCQSPQWLKSRLEAMGTRSINNLVDISNYVLYELGQPTHFYDRDQLKTNSLLVKRAKPGQKFKALDEKEYLLSEKNLMILDGNDYVGIAGVMGGQDSEISDNTTALVIESAAFTASAVRRSARSAGIESEAKKRFERGVDPSKSKAALLRCVDLISQIAEEQNLKLKISEVKTAGNAEAQHKTVKLRLNQIKRYLGIDIDKKIVVDLLKPLDIKYIKDTKASDRDGSTALEFDIPSFRQSDIYREEDLIEEIARLYGYDQIPSTPPSSSVTTAISTDKENKTGYVQNVMVAHGFSQAILSSLIGDTLTCNEKKFAGVHDFDLEVRMHNPLSREHSVLRQSLIPGLVQAASRNFAYDKTVNIKLYEIGKTYFFNPKNKSSNQTPTIEKDKFAAIMIAKDNSWKQSKHNERDFYYFKSIVEKLFPRASFNAIPDNSGLTSLCHPGISAIVVEDNREVGYLAKLHPSIAKEWDLPDYTFVLELDLPKINKNKFKSVPNTPIIDRDITVDVPSELSSQTICDLMKKSGSQYLTHIDLVSVYEKDKTLKSLSYRLKWQSDSETLTGEAIDAEVKKIKDELKAKLGATFRE